MEGAKETSIDDLSREELIKKCKRLALFAQKAKSAKDDYSDQLKKAKEFEIQLREEVESLKALTKKYDDENEWKTKAEDYHSKWKILELKLVEFQKTYSEEKEKHAKLEAKLEKLEEKSEKSGSDSGLATVIETEIESVNEKLDEYVSLSARYKLDCENFQKKNSVLETELNSVKNSYENLISTYRGVVEGGLEHCKGLRECCDRILPSEEKLRILWRGVSLGKEGLEVLRRETKEEVAGFLRDYEEMRVSVGRALSDVVRMLTESSGEMLAEMNEMNQALKERGEVISKLEEDNGSLKIEASENEAKNKKLQERLAVLDEEITKLHSQIQMKDKTIHEMEEEIFRLRNSDPAAETLSTSTISKMEESQRMADLEESFEDRYNKLKIVAIKLKKRVAEHDLERAKLVKEREEFQSKIATLQNQAKAVKTLQDDYDALQDKFDKEHREARELQKSLNKAREELHVLRQQIDGLKNDRSNFTQEKATFEMVKKELFGQIQSLKKDIEKEQVKIQEGEIARVQLQEVVKEMEKKLVEEREKHSVTLASLEEERHKQKKQTLLTLEMADYERTVKEMNRKINVKDDQIRELTANLETQRELSKTLQESLNSLESRVAAEQATADAAKARQSSLQEEVSHFRTSVDETVAKLTDAERLAHERALELDGIKMDLSAALAEQTKIEEKSRSIQESLRAEVNALEDKRQHLEATLNQKELELDELRKEFDGYKIRAQSVLRQSQQNGTPGRQLDIEQELIQLKSSNEAVKMRLEEAVKQMELAKQQRSAAVEEKERLQIRLQEMQGEIKELNSANVQLQLAEARARDAGEEAVRVLRVQQETLVQCYKRELEEMEEKHKRELEAARAAQQQAELALQLHVGRSSPQNHHKRQPSTGFVPVRSERETLDVLMLEREACEGSESVDSPSPRVVPLEQLLLPPPASTSSSQWAAKLEKAESRIQHLSNLLSDAENDAARLQQLNQLLKEEIRRKERNVAREEHASNLEYLKNIVVKFATLPRGDERLRLVPVLNTILKLSREEEERLINAAKGDLPQAGWGAYFWAGT